MHCYAFMLWFGVKVLQLRVPVKVLHVLFYTYSRTSTQTTAWTLLMYSFKQMQTYKMVARGKYDSQYYEMAFHFFPPKVLRHLDDTHCFPHISLGRALKRHACTTEMNKDFGGWRQPISLEKENHPLISFCTGNELPFVKRHFSGALQS